jgi:hypothetical protein
LSVAEKELSSVNQVIIACEQPASLFNELCNEIEFEKKIIPVLVYFDLCDRAGWTNDRFAFAVPAALLSVLDFVSPSPPVLGIVSVGVCLLLGVGGAALDVALLLSDGLAVTILFVGGLVDIIPRSGYYFC